MTTAIEKPHWVIGLSAWLGALLSGMAVSVSGSDFLSAISATRNGPGALLMFPFALLGMSLGSVAAWKIERPLRNSKPGRAALLAIWGGLVSLACIPASTVVDRTPFAGSPATAVGSLRTIVASNVSYKGSYHTYAPSLQNLGGDAPCNASPQTACLIDPVLAGGLKQNYRLIYVAGERDVKGSIKTYALSAEPVGPGTDRWPRYFVDQTGVIRFEKDRAATAHSHPLE